MGGGEFWFLGLSFNLSDLLNLVFLVTGEENGESGTELAGGEEKLGELLWLLELFLPCILSNFWTEGGDKGEIAVANGGVWQFFGEK